MRPIGLLAGLTLAFVATLAVAASAEYNPVRKQPATEQQVQRIIVKFKSTGTNARIQSVSASSAMQSLAARAQVTLTESRSITSDLHVMEWKTQSSGESVEAALARLRADSAVEYAETDQRRFPHAVPNDPLFTGQWWLQNAQAAASNAVTAWDTTTGSNGVVVAVLDTGIRYGHTDLRDSTAGTNRLLPGYDFVSGDPGGGFVTSNDGNGRDSDPSDPGDYVTTADAAASPFSGCTTGNSSWHGTRVSGMIGALSNNSNGVSGMTWSGYILPVRVLGKCGGWDSDILAAMLWAAGVHLDGITDNPYPAKIENLSLGAVTTCSTSYKTVMSQLTALGVLVVASAGNEGGPVDSPANCPGVAAIAGLRHTGTKVGFSSLGSEVALSAPAGNCVNTGAADPCLFSLDTTTNNGTTTPTTSAYTDQYNYNLGTSFSSPIVAGIASLMLSVNGNLTGTQLLARLKEGATTFPVSTDTTVPTCHVPASSADLQTSECNCTTTTCGAGMANAAQSVVAALRPIAAVTVPASVTAGQNVTLSATGSAAACNRTVVSYSWTTVSGTNTSAISGASTSTATVVAPAADTSYTVRVTVTDSSGATDTADVAVSSTAATTTAPATAGTATCLTALSYTAPTTAADSDSSGTVTTDPGTDTGTTTTNPITSSGGGGGSLDWMVLLALAGLLPWRRARAYVRVKPRGRRMPK